MKLVFRLTSNVVLGVLALVAFSEIGHAEDPPASPRLTVVELYQSQGCSSCPPAEANLNAIAGQPAILALSFGVTYWDNLGWKDTFASQAFTDRQYDYSHYQKQNGVYTPQVIVNGQQNLVGSDRAQLDQAISQSHLQGPTLSWSNGRLLVGEGNAPEPANVWLVRYDPRTINVPIRAGENSGRRLPHRNVVRELINLGTWNGKATGFTVPTASLPGLSTAALVQVKGGGAILGAAKQTDASQPPVHAD